MKLIFNLNCTITKEETFPLISSHFEINEQIIELRNQTIKGN